MKKPREYALYKGDKLLCIGTIKEIANELGILEETVSYYKTNAYQNRLARRKSSTNVRVLICLDDEEGE